MVPVRAYGSDSFTNSENQNERDKKVVIVFYMPQAPKSKTWSSDFYSLTANELANAIWVPPNQIKAIGLGTFFKTSAEFWMKLQMTSDLRYAEKALPARVRKSIEDNRSVLT